MLILDTNHLSEIIRNSARGRSLIDKLTSSTQSPATTILTIEELLRGWLARIRREHDPMEAVALYAKLQEIVELAADWTVLSWDDDAAAVFSRLTKQRLGIGSMDLKIASIVLAKKATLLSRNLRDFERVPNVVVEDWLS